MGVWLWGIIAVAGYLTLRYIKENIKNNKRLKQDVESQRKQISQKNETINHLELDALYKDEQIQKKIKEIEELKQKLEENKVDFKQKKEAYKRYVYALREETLQTIPTSIKQIPTLWADIKLCVLDKELAEMEMWNNRIKATTYQQLRTDIAKAKSYIQLYKEYKYKYENLLLSRHPSCAIDHERAVILDLKLNAEELRNEKAGTKREIEALGRRVNEIREGLRREEEKYNQIKLESRIETERWKREIEKFVEAKKTEINTQEDDNIILDKMAEEWSEYQRVIWDHAVEHLLNKRRPISIETATEYRSELNAFKKDILSKYKEADLKYKYLLSLFPELQEYIDGEAVQEATSAIPEELEDKREHYIPKEEWLSLSDTQRSQIALDRYNERRRLTNAQVGRDYEEYIAFLFRERCKGAVIDMYGEQKGLADLGRDLIVKHRGKIYIVQCKRWSQEKVIREKHIMQLFGSTIEYCWEMKKDGIHPLDVVGKTIIPVFVSTTQLSETAARFAERLGVIATQVPMGEYPQIKCNIGIDGEKIYHLPFDQQYNTTIIERKKGEFYAWTVEEAERAGYRRAQRHYYN